MCLFENACKGIKSRAEKQKIFGPLKVKESQSSVSQGDKFFCLHSKYYIWNSPKFMSYHLSSNICENQLSKSDRVEVYILSYILYIL